MYTYYEIKSLTFICLHSNFSLLILHSFRFFLLFYSFHLYPLYPSSFLYIEIRYMLTAISKHIPYLLNRFILILNLPLYLDHFWHFYAIGIYTNTFNNYICFWFITTVGFYILNRLYHFNS